MSGNVAEIARFPARSPLHDIHNLAILSKENERACPGEARKNREK